MTENDFIKFSKELLDCFDVLGKGARVLTEKTIEIYFEDLIDYDIETVVNAIKDCRRSLEFFPVPGQIIERIEGREDEIIDSAYLQLKTTLDKVGYHDSIVFKDKKISLSVKDMGGLQEAHNKILREKKDFAFFDFKRSYKKYLKMEKSGKVFEGNIKCMGYTESLGGVYKIVFVDEEVKKVIEMIPPEWKPFILANREARKGLESGKQPDRLPQKVSGNTVEEIVENIGVKKLNS